MKSTQFPWQEIAGLALSMKAEALDLHSVPYSTDPGEWHTYSDIPLQACPNQRTIVSPETNINMYPLGSMACWASYQLCHKPKSLPDAPIFQVLPCGQTLQARTRDRTGQAIASPVTLVSRLDGIFRLSCQSLGGKYGEEGCTRILKICCARLGILTFAFFGHHFRG